MNMEKIGDLRRDEKFSRKTVKGFTLIEMLIVIAIIGILVGMISIITAGFVRNSTFESCNNKAQLVYTAVQNSLIQAEITQDLSMFDVGYLKPSGTSLPSDKLIYAELVLCLNNGEIDSTKDIKITSYYNGQPTGSMTYPPTVAWDFSKGKPKSTSDESYIRRGKSIKFYNNYIVNNLSEEMTGTCQIFIDLANYTVDSVIFNEVPGNEIDYLNRWYFNSGTAKSKKTSGFYAVRSLFTQRDIYKVKGDYFGCYPMLDDVGQLGSADSDYSLAAKNNTIENVTT